MCITKRSIEQKQERLGMSKINSDGELMTITRYDKNDDIDVTFEDGTIVKASFVQFKRGNLRNTFNRIGQSTYNTDGLLMTVIEYNKPTDIIVEFQDGYKKKTRYSDFLLGSVRNPYFKSVYGVGYLGDGQYVSSINHKETLQYKTWNHMLRRVYKKYTNKDASYYDCLVCNEWHNFQNFAKWHDENYYTVDNEEIHLDKDFKNKARVYSPENCIFLPRNINMILIKRKSLRGEYPIGCALDKQRNKIRVQLNRYNKIYDLGHFDNKIDAFNAYKQAKEAYIKEVADSYKHKIPEYIYNILINYQVEITD